MSFFYWVVNRKSQNCLKWNRRKKSVQRRWILQTVNIETTYIIKDCGVDHYENFFFFEKSKTINYTFHLLQIMIVLTWTFWQSLTHFLIVLKIFLKTVDKRTFLIRVILVRVNSPSQEPTVTNAIQLIWKENLLKRQSKNHWKL